MHLKTGPFIFKNNKIKKIKIERDSFTPNNVKIRLGDEVIWKNHDHVLRHTVVNDDPLIRNSNVLLKGKEFKIIFDRPGEYTFYSSLYPNFERGIVTVDAVDRKGSEYRKNLKDNVLVVVFKLYRTFIKTIGPIKKILSDGFEFVFGNIKILLKMVFGTILDAIEGMYKMTKERVINNK